MLSYQKLSKRSKAIIQYRAYNSFFIWLTYNNISTTKQRTSFPSHTTHISAPFYIIMSQWEQDEEYKSVFVSQPDDMVACCIQTKKPTRTRTLPFSYYIQLILLCRYFVVTSYLRIYFRSNSMNNVITVIRSTLLRRDTAYYYLENLPFYYIKRNIYI